MFTKYKITTNIIIVLCTIFILNNYLFDKEIILKNFTINYDSFINNPLVLITSIFLHLDIMHIIMNCIALFQIGYILEPLISRKRYLKLFIVSGLLSSIFSIGFIYFFKIYYQIDSINSIHSQDYLYMYVLGASGAIFGLYIYMSLITNEMKSFYANVIIFHIIVFIAHIPIAWYAHLGGIVGGFLYYTFEKFYYGSKMLNRRKFN